MKNIIPYKLFESSESDSNEIENTKSYLIDIFQELIDIGVDIDIDHDFIKCGDSEYMTDILLDILTHNTFIEDIDEYLQSSIDYMSSNGYKLINISVYVDSVYVDDELKYIYDYDELKSGLSKFKDDYREEGAKKHSWVETIKIQYRK